MAKTITDLLITLEKLKDTLESKMPDIAAGAALGLKALAEKDIQEKGFGAVYSTNAVANQKLRQNILNNRGRDFLIKRDKQGLRATTYKDFRESQGLQTGHVDLTYTGKMWAGISVIKNSKSGGVYTATLGHNNLNGAFKMDENYKRYGDFIAKVTDKQDVQAVAEYVQDEIISIIKEVFNE